MKQSIVRIAVAGAVAVATLAVAAPAQALPMDRDSRGRCSEGSRWELSLDRELNRIEVDFEVDGPRRADWTVRITHNGTQVLNRTRRANLRGEAEFFVRVNAPRGQQHRFVVNASRPNGETCTARDTL